MDSLSDSISDSSREQTAREAGRKAEIDTVRRLLDVPIDHFIEVTLVQLTVGADFPAAQYVSGSSTAATATPVTTVDATASGTQAPAPTDLTEMAETNTPCVK
jgi:hypothetical protein